MGTHPNPIRPEYLTRTNISTPPQVLPPESIYPIVPDPGSASSPTSTPIPQIQDLNNDSIPPTVLSSLADNFSTDVPTISDSDEIDESPQVMCRVMRASHGIVKPNPKYALTIASLDIIVPRSPKFALSLFQNGDWPWKKKLRPLTTTTHEHWFCDVLTIM